MLELVVVISLPLSTLMLPAESHIKLILSLIYIGHYEQKDVYLYNLSCKVFFLKFTGDKEVLKACFDSKWTSGGHN